MGKTFSGGIRLSTGFKLEVPYPIADYMVVDDVADLDSLNNTFEGMFVYVKSEQNFYVLLEDGWHTHGLGEDDKSNQVEAEEGEDNEKWMTPLRVAQAIDARALINHDPYEHQVIPNNRTIILRTNETWRVFDSLKIGDGASILFNTDSALELI